MDGDFFMFRLLNRIIRRGENTAGFLNQRPFFGYSEKGQIALIIIVIIAIVIAFFAITLNIGRIGQIKTITTIASNSAAAFLASQMAGYAEYLYQVQLGGHGPGDPNAGDDLANCAASGVVVQIIALIAIVASLLIPGAQTTTGFWVNFWISVGLMTASIVINITVIEPELTKQWNKIMNTMSSADQFLQQGIEIGLQNAVEDQAVVDDITDFDADGFFGYETVGGITQPKDVVSRFGEKYTEMLKEMVQKIPSADTHVIDDFKTALKEFLKKDTDNWGLWDPYTDSCGFINNIGHPCCIPPVTLKQYQECNVCCQPPEYRPVGCDSNFSSYCPQTNWPYVYDPLFENDLNNSGADSFVSFREFLGGDDENTQLRFDPDNPENYYYSSDPSGIYRSTDATGIFPALWDIADRTTLANNAVDSLGYPEGCFWCDKRFSSVCNSYEADGRLSLPVPDCVGDACCLSSLDTEGGGGYFDRVPNVPDMLIGTNQCLGEAGVIDWWKKGDQRYCSTIPPYDQDCIGKQCQSSCAAPACIDDSENWGEQCLPDKECADTGINKALWTEDQIDNIRYTLDSFIGWADETINKSTADIASDFLNWYTSQAGTWIGIGGQLDQTVVSLTTWKTILSSWLGRIYPASNCYDFCLPPKGCSGYDSDTPATIDNIIACLWDNYEDNKDSDPNLAAKFSTRAVFLSSAKDRVANIINAITTALDSQPSAPLNFTRFLSDPRVQALLDEVERLQNVPLEASLLAIYGWKSRPADNRKGKYFWHIVRSEARIPGRCNNRCGRDAPGDAGNHEPGWPWVKRYEPNRAETCYVLGDSFDRYADGTENTDCHDDYKEWSHATKCFKGGTVKSRVTRYDEDKDLALTFANTVPIWQMVFHHPARQAASQSSKDLIAQLPSQCDPNGDGAFIINDITKNVDCWNTVGYLLQRGVMSQTCAEYFFHQNPTEGNSARNGFSMKFSSCQGEF